MEGEGSGLLLVSLLLLLYVSYSLCLSQFTIHIRIHSSCYTRIILSQTHAHTTHYTQTSVPCSSVPTLRTRFIVHSTELIEV